MNDKMNSNMLIVFALILSVGLFAAYNWKYNKSNNTTTSKQQNWDKEWSTQPPQKPQPQPDSKPISPPQPEIKSYEEAIKIAKTQDKKMFVFFEEDECAWCKKMKSETFVDPRVRAELSKYVIYYANKNETALARKYNVKSIPSYFIASLSYFNREKIEKSGQGFKTVDQFIEWLNGNRDNLLPRDNDRNFSPRNPG